MKLPKYTLRNILLFASLLMSFSLYAGKDDGESIYYYNGIPGCGCFQHCNCYYKWGDPSTNHNSPEDVVWHTFMEEIIKAKRVGPYTGYDFTDLCRALGYMGGHDLAMFSEYLNAIEIYKGIFERAGQRSINDFQKDIDLAKEFPYRYPRNLVKDYEAIIAKTRKQIIDGKAALSTIIDKIIPLYKNILTKCTHNSSYNLALTYNEGLLGFVVGDYETALTKINEFVLFAETSKSKEKLLTSKIYQQLGESQVEVGLYHEAIATLTKSLQKDSSNTEAYFQRAIANLETNNFDDAVVDYLASDKSKNLKDVKSIVPDNFQDAFLKGLTEGSSEALINFFPSLYSFAYGNVFHPIEALTNFTNTCYELMKIEAEYLKEAVKDIQVETPLDCQLTSILLKPGLKRLYEKMDELSPAEQGHILGHTIGTYGIDFIAGAGLIKGVSNCAKLAQACKTAREAGRIYELETIAQSATALESISVQAVERVAIRETIVQGAKSGRVVIQNPNVQFHVMQEKHAWDKVIQVTGNAEEDIRKVVSLLEEKNVLSMEALIEEEVSPGIIKKEYIISDGEYRIKAIFNEYANEEKIFLKDAWVITK